MSCTNQSGSINKTFIIESPDVISGTTPVFSACTVLYTNKVESCSGDTEVLLTSGATVFNTDLVPVNPDTVSVGQPTRRFRELNAVSGSVSVWSATTRVHTPELHLGLDSSGNTRTITADNSVIQNDCLYGGTY